MQSPVYRIVQIKYKVVKGIQHVHCLGGEVHSAVHDLQVRKYGHKVHCMNSKTILIAKWPPNWKNFPTSCRSQQLCRGK